jgi:prepilin-type N-terminal cleavage/methylation domain-containing protein
VSTTPELDRHTVAAQHRERRDRGFTLIEIMVALGVLMIVATALVPQVIGGIRATAVARDITQAKGVAQARLETMRAMPYYVGREAGDFIDVLDTYYRNTTTPSVAASCSGTLSALPPTSWSGYLPPSAARCPWEPAGAAYRKVINPIQAPGLGAFSMTVTTRFLDVNAAPVTPPSFYNSQTAGSDQPAANQIGVTVAVFYRSHNGVKYTSTYTQIERSIPIDPLIRTRAQATTVQASSAARNWKDWEIGDLDPTEGGSTNDQINLMAALGVVNLTGELFSGSRVVSSVAAGTGSTSAPSAVTGASTNLTAPVDTPAQSTTVGDVALPNGCRWICLGTTGTKDVSGVSDSGQPRSGTPTNPATAFVPANATRNGLWFDNGRWRNRLQLLNNSPMVSLDTTIASLPQVSDCAVGGTSSPTNPHALQATGYLDATHHDDPDRSSAACATAQAGVVRVFPTSFAPNGVLRITLDQAVARCTSGSGVTPSASASYRATLRYWNGSGYTAVTSLRNTNNTDPLDAISLTQVIDPASGLTLGDYVQSWSSVTNDEVTTTVSGRSTQAALPAAVTVHTGPTRTFPSGWGSNADETSAISLSVGAVSCEAMDQR